MAGRLIFMALLPATLLAAEPAPPLPDWTLNAAEQMALRDLINQLERERATANANALHWYRKHQECSGKVQI